VTPAPPASGEQFEIAFGDQRAVVTEVGAGLRSFTVDDRDVIDGYGTDSMSRSGRGQILAPWPNRLEDGSYEFGGRRHQVPLNELDAHNAIHGLVRWSAWAVRQLDAQRVVMEHDLHPQPGYPFSLTLTNEYTLSGAGLSVRMTAANRGGESCPYGVGAHPYLTLGTAVDTLTLRVPARSVLDADSRGLPRGAAPVDGTSYDFRRPRAIGATILDHCFRDLERDDDGLARVVLRDPDAGTGVTLWVDGTFPYLMVFTGDPLPDVARRALAVEPMSCPPNAFRTNTAVIELAPGESASGVWGITPSAPAGA
jgi:aldose 1-epimerase